MTRVYYNSQVNCLFVQGTKQIYPARSLEYTVENEDVIIWLLNGELPILSLHYSNYANKNGNSFNTIQELTNYLDIEFSKSYDDLDIINDSINNTTQVYSSEKVEDRLTEEVGDDDFNYTLLFENQLSQN